MERIELTETGSMGRAALTAVKKSLPDARFYLSGRACAKAEIRRLGFIYRAARLFGRYTTLQPRLSLIP